MLFNSEILGKAEEATFFCFSALDAPVGVLQLDKICGIIIL